MKQATRNIGVILRKTELITSTAMRTSTPATDESSIVSEMCG
jgi:hypothetical protein